MNLLELRKKFVSVSGRYDLVVDSEDWADSGANYYLNAGGRYLNRIVDVSQNFAKTGIMLLPGYGSIVYSHCRAIQQIFISDGTTYNLTFDANLVQNGSRRPTAYKYSTIHHSPALTEENITCLPLDGLDVLVAPNRSLNCIVFDSFADRPYLITLYGLFHNTDLLEDSDINFWSETYPQLLIKAAMYELEVEYRNTEGANNWMEAIKADVIAIDNDNVEQEIANTGAY